MNTQGSIQKFFRVYLPNDTKDDMNLPLVPDEISGTPLPRKVTVKSVSSGIVWRMKMTTNGEDNTVFLRDGWKNIAKDENLKEPSFLVFEFDGSRVFQFCVYDHGSKCKRMRTPTEKEVIEVDSEEEEEETDDDGDDGDDVSVEDEESKEWLDESPKRKERGGTSRRRSYLKTDGVKFEKYLDNKLNPYFPMDVTKKRTRIPAPLIKDYNLKFPKLVVVSDKIGKLKKKIAVWKNKSVILTGLGSITRRNHVKAGDVMVCDLKMVDGHHGMVREVKIHVIKG